MSNPFTSWLRAYLALQSHANDARGVVAILDEHEETTARFPRTTGNDVIAIAAVLDPVVRALPLRWGGHGLARRWRDAIDEMARLATEDGNEPYRGNQAFWSALGRVCIHLHVDGSELPDEAAWRALLAMFDEQPRNGGPSGGGPFKTFENVKTYDELFLAHRNYLRDLRGADEMDPEPGWMGGKKLIPRSTNGDVIALLDYWNQALYDTRKTFGHEGVAKRWEAARDEVNKLARSTTDKDAVYPANNHFWRTLQAVAIQIAVSNEAPTKWDLAIESIKDSVRKLPSEIADIAGSAGHGVGKIANEIGKGLFSGAGLPLLIGAGLLGVFLISRNGEKKSKEA